MEKLNKFLIWASGKKSLTAVILMATNGYLLEKAIYGQLEFTYISVMIGAIFGTASYITKKAYLQK